ncbi:CopG family transcriptional regulator [Lacimicrobium sp. SS2-24]|uniref:ribbon-helix-helix domain-containing protein n=1 Tax=Lacimicrobium sp. SS2-24 TaxID=2005569 RepID=UPI000B4AB7C5|nr:CopG family transcriptional regulator [Lacimicrobium sp. SS2-24]
MTFASLKKNSPSASPNAVSVDEFIEDAENYARGLNKVIRLHPGATADQQGHGAPLKTTSVTLTTEARATLEQLAATTGISRSRLMRIWLAGVEIELEKDRYLASQVR